MGSGIRFWVPEDPPVADRTLTFSAKKHFDGSVQGQVELVIHYKGVESFLKASGKITCLTVDGDEAWIGGYFTHGRWLDPPWFYFYAKDNGQGANAPPDVLSGLAPWEPQSNAEAWCAEAPADLWGIFTFDIEAGNIKVSG
jgi:hypothetical protein